MLDRWNQNGSSSTGCGCNCGSGLIVVEVPGIQGAQGDRGASVRFSGALAEGQTDKISTLKPSNDVKTGDLVLNSSGQLFQIESVDEVAQTFTVGELAGAIDISQIDDESVSESSLWSSAKIHTLLGEAVDFVKTFETALHEQPTVS